MGRRNKRNKNKQTKGQRPNEANYDKSDPFMLEKPIVEYYSVV